MKHYRLTIDVYVEDAVQLRAVAQKFSLSNGFDSIEDYNEIRNASEDPTRYDLLEVWPEIPNPAGLGIVIGDYDAEED